MKTPTRIERPEWGGWWLDTSDHTLNYKHYWIALDRCDTSAEVLDWIMQLDCKSWMPPAGIAGLVRIFHDVLNPQGTLCSMGSERGPLDTKAQVTAFLSGREPT